MLCESQIVHFLEKNCPNIWSILNQQAKRSPPNGFQEFLSGKWAEEGKVLLQLADKRISKLIEKTSERLVGDTYRRDLSGADSENRLAELFCEISLTDSLAGIASDTPVLRPRTEIGTECDVKVVIEGSDLYGESKRLADKWEGGIRSIAKSKSPPESKPTDSSRPRAMDLYSKLRDAPRQFPSETLNVIFLFHPSIWNTELYIRQALFGDKSSFDESSQPSLYDDGLYSLSEWQKISACVYSRVNSNGTLSIVNIWKNSKAAVGIPDDVAKKLKDAR
jgi:hypothetical protein